MTALKFIELAQTALRKFAHKDLTCAGEPPEIITNPATGGIAIGCPKCKRMILITAVQQAEKLIVGGEEQMQVKPRFKLL